MHMAKRHQEKKVGQGIRNRSWAPVKHWAHVMGFRQADPGELDFGWSPGWTRGPLYASLLFLTGGIVVDMFSVHWWPLSVLLTITSVSFFAGHLVAVRACSG